MQMVIAKRQKEEAEEQLLEALRAIEEEREEFKKQLQCVGGFPRSKTWPAHAIVASSLRVCGWPEPAEPPRTAQLRRGSSIKWRWMSCSLP